MRWLRTLRSTQPRNQAGEEMAPAVPGPDFMCIGLQKAGTRWLYQQLRMHPDFWMPPIKELHFFDKRFESERGLEKIRRESERASQKVRNGSATPIESKDYLFFQLVASRGQDQLSLDWYECLFDPKGALISGDITPAYSILQEHTIKEIHSRFPKMKVILLLRDPVERLWSQLCMQWRRNEISAEDLSDRDWVRARVLTRSAHIERMYPTKIWRRWGTSFEPQNMGFWFLEDIAGAPLDTVSSIVEFIGGSPVSELKLGVNTKASDKKLKLSEYVRAELAQILDEELTACATLFGSHALSWREKYSE